MKNPVMTFEQWLDKEGPELDIEDAESGADREYDYDRAERRERQYEAYIDNEFEKDTEQ